VSVAFGPSSVSAVLRTLSDSTDEPTVAVALLLLLRSVAAEWSHAMLVVCAGREGKTLLSLEDDFGTLSISALVRLKPASLVAAIEANPALAFGFEIERERPSSIVLRTQRPPMPTPSELPSLDLLVRAGLVTSIV